MSVPGAAAKTYTVEWYNLKNNTAVPDGNVAEADIMVPQFQVSLRCGVGRRYKRVRFVWNVLLRAAHIFKQIVPETVSMKVAFTYSMMMLRAVCCVHN